jgi:hypothetical protein
MIAKKTAYQKTIHNLTLTYCLPVMIAKKTAYQKTIHNLTLTYCLPVMIAKKTAYQKPIDQNHHHHITHTV